MGMEMCIEARKPMTSWKKIFELIKFDLRTGAAMNFERTESKPLEVSISQVKISSMFHDQFGKVWKVSASDHMPY